MVLTKQLQVLIQSSLAQGRDYEDIRAILMKQGFQESDITSLFSDYRGGVGATQAQQSEVKSEFDDALSPTELGIYKAEVDEKAVEQVVNKTPAPAFVHPPVKKDFIPVGFEKEASAQKRVQDDVTTFMNVGTNTQTAKDILLKQQTSVPVNFAQKEKLPAPGTTLLPNEMAPNTTQLPEIASTPQAEPKVFNEQGVSENETPQVFEAPVVPQRINTSQKYINVGLSGMPEIEKVMLEEQTKKIEKSPWPLVIVLIFLLAMIGGGLYWWFYIFNANTGEPTESQKLLQELEAQKQKEEEAELPPEPTGPVDPFTGLPLEVQN